MQIFAGLRCRVQHQMTAGSPITAIFGAFGHYVFRTFRHKAKLIGHSYGVTGGLIKCSWCHFFFFQRVISELPRPITAKLRHMIGTCVYFINWLQKFGELSLPPKKKLGPKTCKISVDFIQPPTLIANISGTAQDIQNLKTNSSTAIPPALYEKRPVNFGPLITETKMWVRTH